MAIVQNPLIGSAKNSAGSMTFARVKGKNILKTKAFSVKNPKTWPQRDNRLRFLIISLLSLFVVNEKNYTIPERKNTPSPADLAGKVKAKCKDAVSVLLGVISYAGNLLSVGGNKMLSFIPTSILLEAGNEITVTWDALQTGAQKTADVRLAVILFNVTQKQGLRDDNSGAGYLVATETATSVCPLTWNEDDQVILLLETYSNLTDAMPGEKYATGWTGRPDVVSTNAMMVELA